MRIDGEEFVVRGVVWMIRADRLLWEATQKVVWIASYFLVAMPHECLCSVVDAVFKESLIPNGRDHH